MTSSPLARSHRDLSRTRIRRLRERDGEDAVLHEGGRLFGIDLDRKREAPREAERRTLLTMRRVALGSARLALSGKREHAIVQRDLDVLFGQARNVTGDDEI